MSNKGKHTIESILQHINSSDRALERALIVIWGNTTGKELYLLEKDLTLYAEAIFAKRGISNNCKLHARKELRKTKYYGILRRCADEIMEGK